MERSQILEAMGELKLYGMRGAYDEIVATAVKRQHEPQMGSTKFHGLTAEVDPIAGHGAEGACGFTIPSRRGPIGLDALPQFFTVRGGGYFFLPGRQLLSYLAGK